MAGSLEARWTCWLWAAALPSLLLLATCAGKPGRVVQPIQFSHKVHLDQELDCTTCHEGADNAAHATIPVLDTCMMCHSDANGTNPEEPKVRAYAAAGLEIPWVRVNRLPGHVYFSHLAHVKWAGLECAQCHGDMRKRERPVTSSQISELTMKRCVSCHQSRQARTDCLTCHK